MEKIEAPNIIYLLFEGDVLCWCEDPAPGIGMDEKDSVKYIKVKSSFFTQKLYNYFKDYHNTYLTDEELKRIINLLTDE